MRGAGRTGLVCCCWTSAASRASRARRASSIRRRSRARCNARFLTALRSGFADVLSSTITAGPPSVAILVAAALPSSGSRSGAGTAGAEPLAAGSADVSAIAATTSTSATGTSVPTGPDGVPVVASVAGAGCLSSMLRAATLSGSAGLSSAAVPAALRYPAISGTAAERSSSRGFSAAGRSTRSRARLGIGSSFSLAKTGSGGARRDGRLANSSCAARNRAAAPSPNTRIDIERTIAVNRKRKPGSMDASSALLKSAGLLMPRERGDHSLTDSHVRTWRIRLN